jgi:hypothetical protein
VPNISNLQISPERLEAEIFLSKLSYDTRLQLLAY